jgi:beta-glucosidase
VQRPRASAPTARNSYEQCDAKEQLLASEETAFAEVDAGEVETEGLAVAETDLGSPKLVLEAVEQDAFKAIEATPVDDLDDNTRPSQEAEPCGIAPAPRTCPSAPGTSPPLVSAWPRVGVVACAGSGLLLGVVVCACFGVVDRDAKWGQGLVRKATIPAAAAEGLTETAAAAEPATEERLAQRHRQRRQAQSDALAARSFSLRPWAQARAMARDVEAQLTGPERLSLIHGQGFMKVGAWVGYISAIPRLGIPDLKVQDASSGFRPTGEEHEYGTVTQWPSLLGLAATWDEELIGQVAGAIAQEFKGKGANVLLGPGLNVHRTPYGGRNFEYLPGEAPYLGAKLARAYIEGVQGEGVMAIMKHFGFNEQETNRKQMNSVVSEKDAWEVYYPPFEAAIEAGVGGAMCAYNKVNGTYACHNGKVLQEDLKGKMGFEGFVMSDWEALHDSWALMGGTDMEMPGGPGGYFNWKSLGGVIHQHPEAFNEAARRILAAIYHLRLEEGPSCSGPCYAERNTIQRTKAHLDLAKKAAADGVVLLKNDGILPLRSVRQLAVIGPAANVKDTLNVWGAGSPYSGGGSGHVASTHVVTPLQGIGARAASLNIKIVSGIDASDLIKGDLSALSDTDVVIVVADATAKESVDRGGLALDSSADALITAVAGSKPTVVLMEIPGAVVTPWRDQVAAVACMFAGGEETGAAWASVLFGDVHPSGRLPISMPVSEEGLIRPGEATVIYNESAVSDVATAFPFGHGLSYTNFEFGTPLRSRMDCLEALCFAMNITNMGLAKGRETVQVYIQFGYRADWPSSTLYRLQHPHKPKLELRTFQKTPELEPGRSVELIFSLSRRELSTYAVEAGEWRLEPRFHVHVGASSLDIRQRFHVNLLEPAPTTSSPPPSAPQSQSRRHHHRAGAGSDCWPRPRPLLFALVVSALWGCRLGLEM